MYDRGGKKEIRTRASRGFRFLIPAFAAILAATSFDSIADTRLVHAAQSLQTERKLATTDPNSASFEVASIKPNDSDKGGSHYSHFSSGQGRLIATNELLRDFIMDAYAPPGGRLQDNQLIGGPAWISVKRYDIDAKVDDAVRDEWMKLPDDQQSELMRRAERALLADRFKLAVTVEKKDEPVYALVIAKGGPKLTPAKPEDAPENIPKTQPPSIDLIGPLDHLAFALGRMQIFRDKPFINETGLTGRYVVSLHYGGTSDPDGPSIFTALEEQLGLRVESTKAQVDTIAIDSIEEPTPN